MSVIPVKTGKIEYSVAQNIAAPHCFTTRLGGVSTGIFDSLNLNFSRGDDPKCVVENFRRIGKLLGFTPEDVVNARQIHSDIVVRVDERNRGKLDVAGASPECDAMITAIREETIRRMFLVQLRSNQEVKREKVARETGTAAATQTQVKKAPVRNAGKKVGPNDPCPCGSGKKYKKCCMQKDKIN